MKSRFKRKLKRIISLEIAIEYKSCLYFACVIFFYFVYLLCNKIYSAKVLHMFEIILTAYLNVYIQVYVFRNFDEADRIGKRDALGIFFCTCLYTAASYLLNWYERGAGVTLLFFLYMLLLYFCVYLCNKIKRIIDTENLNRMLTEFKKGEESER